MTSVVCSTYDLTRDILRTIPVLAPYLFCRVASHLFTGGFVGISKLPALFGWYIRYGIGIKWGWLTLQIAYEAPILEVYSPLFYINII